MCNLRLSARKGKVRISVNVSNLDTACHQLEHRGYTVDGAQLHKANEGNGKRWLRNALREVNG